MPTTQPRITARKITAAAKRYGHTVKSMQMTGEQVTVFALDGDTGAARSYCGAMVQEALEAEGYGVTRTGSVLTVTPAAPDELATTAVDTDGAPAD